MALGSITTPKVKTYTQSGPASYATGGFVVTNVTDDFSWVGFVDVQVVTRGSLPAVDYETDCNVNASGAESLGNAVIKIVRGRYDKATIFNPSGNPSGTTVQTSKTATADTTNSNHSHDIDHDHDVVTSATNNAAGVAVNLNLGNGQMDNHTHDFDVPAFTGTSSITSHTHDRSFEYQHAHSINTATSSVSVVELGSGTNISTTSFKITIYGFGSS